MKGRKLGITRLVVLVGALVHTNPLAAVDASTLSTTELKKLVEAGEARVAAAFGKHKSVIVQGKITDPDERLLLLVGRAIPNGSGIEGFGIHLDPSCLMVQNPKGRIAAGSYMDGPPFGKDLFYLGEGRAKNQFGTSISCSIYGGFDELPANIRAAVKKASEDVQPLKAELKRKLEAEWMAAEATRLKRVERDRTEHKQEQKQQEIEAARPENRRRRLEEQRVRVENDVQRLEEDYKTRALSYTEEQNSAGGNYHERNRQALLRRANDPGITTPGYRESLLKQAQAEAVKAEEFSKKLNAPRKEYEREKAAKLATMKDLDEQIVALGGFASSVQTSSEPVESEDSGSAPRPTNPALPGLIQKRREAREEQAACGEGTACLQRTINKLTILNRQIRELGGS